MKQRLLNLFEKLAEGTLVVVFVLLALVALFVATSAGIALSKATYAVFSGWLGV